MYIFYLYLLACLPTVCAVSTIVPFPKNTRRNLSDSSNYRAIALCSLICKLFDTIIIEKHEDNLISDALSLVIRNNLLI